VYVGCGAEPGSIGVGAVGTEEERHAAAVTNRRPATTIQEHDCGNMEYLSRRSRIEVNASGPDS
jgi:hypothetical protein